MEIDLTFLSQIDPQLIENSIITLTIVFSVFFLFVILKFYHSWIWLPGKQLKYLKDIKYILLAIDIPKENEQSPKAVESIFSVLWGSYTGPNKVQKYFDGQLVPPFSLEIVSIDGYIQYLVRTAVHFRDMVEAAIFSQYPDAQITEVNDYVESVDQKYPSDDYKLWGTELKLFKPDAYPLRTYPVFEHTLTQDFKDPMASILEVFSRLGPGEQAWLQFVITAVKSDWLSRAENVVKKLIGEKSNYKRGLGEILTDPILKFLDWMADMMVIQSEKSATPASPQQKNDIMFLTPSQQNQLSAIQNKMSKLAFETSARYIYVAKKDKYRPATGINPVFGAINQFNSLEINSLIPNSKTLTSVDYFFKKTRIAMLQNNLLSRYKDRINQVGSVTTPFILNIEELATVFHFPDMNVKAPLVKKAEAKRSEPPATLPTQMIGFEQVDDKMPKTFSETLPKEKVGDSSVKQELRLDFANDYFEEKFAKTTQRANPQSKKTSVTTPAQSITDVTVPVINHNDNGTNGTPPPNLPI